MLGKNAIQGRLLLACLKIRLNGRTSVPHGEGAIRVFTISKETMAVFSAAKTETFVERMLVHIRKCFPVEYESLGETATTDTIRYGIASASRYGIQGERDVCKYIDLMLVFGRDFDRNVPWASRILTDRTMNPDIKVFLLYEHALK